MFYHVCYEDKVTRTDSDVLISEEKVDEVHKAVGGFGG